MQILKELQRRNVFRVSIGYLISAWLLSQVADFVLDLIGAPNWVLQVIVLILALGFPVVAFFAWAYEVTPEGIKRESEVDRSQSITHITGKRLDRSIMVLLVVALAYFIWESRFAPGGEAGSAEIAQVAETPENSIPPSTEATTPDDKSIAVLPFDNRSNREEDQFFTDGIHDDLLTTIAKIGSMKVISRTSVMEYRGTTKKIPEIAAELGVAHVLEGGIQRAGNQVRINVQLIDAQTDEHLWAEIFDRELTAENLFAIQSEISNRIAEALEAALTPQEQERVNAMPTDNLAAYEAYHRGKQLMATRRMAELEQATQAFAQAVELDPDFALAWVGVADSHSLLNNYSREPVANSIEVRENAVKKALALAPDLGEAWVSQATIYGDLERDEEAEAAFRKAIELSPNYATAYHWYSLSFSDDMLRSRERLDLVYKAAELDPRSLIIRANLVSELSNQGLYSRAEQEAKNLIELNPEFPNSYHLLVDHHQWQTGEWSKALVNARKFYEADPDQLDGLRHQVEIYVEVGDYESARTAHEAIIDQNPNDLFAGWMDLMMALETGNQPALREAIVWILPQAENYPWLKSLLGYTYLMLGDLRRATETYVQLHPEWLLPDAWDMTLRTHPGQACNMAWLLMNTGEEEMGSRLLEEAIEFHETRLPAAIEHADRFNADMCYMAAGDIEKALESLETQVSHGHIFILDNRLASMAYDPIRHEPRFLAILEERERLVEMQREAIAEL